MAVGAVTVLGTVAIGYSAKADRLQDELDRMKGEVEGLALITAVEGNVIENSPYPMSRSCGSEDDRAAITLEDLDSMLIIPICMDSSGQITIPGSDMLRFKARYLAGISENQDIMERVTDLTEGNVYCIPDEAPEKRVSVDNYSDSL